MNNLRSLFDRVYLKTFFIALTLHELGAFATDDNPFAPRDQDVTKSLPSVIQVIKFLGVLLVGWVAPLVGGYLIFKGCWAGAMSSEQHDKDGWKNKVIFGGCMIAIRVFISMFTTWLT